jgi:hypothetical protein
LTGRNAAALGNREQLVDHSGVRPDGPPGHPRHQSAGPGPVLAGLQQPTRTSDISPPNIGRFQFLDPAAHDFFPNFDEAVTTVQLLRATAGQDPHDRSLTDLVGELSTRSDDFRTRWAAHDVRVHRSGTKKSRHPIVGELTFVACPADPVSS